MSSFRAHAIAVHCVQGPLVNSELERGVVKGWGGGGVCIVLKNATNNSFPLAKNHLIVEKMNALWSLPVEILVV